MLYSLLEFRVGLPPLLGRVHVGRALIVGVGQHGDDGDENGLHCVYRQPSLAGLLVSVPVIPCNNVLVLFIVIYQLWK